MVYQYGDPESSIVLIQSVGKQELPGIENEVSEIQKITGMEFKFVGVSVEHWNHELSPWKAPAVFGAESFGDGAAEMLKRVLDQCQDESRRYYLGGYSLAGLFALWSSYQTDIFTGIAAASPSICFPGFLPYITENPIQSQAVYLSLGDREERTKNPVMSKVGDCIREGYRWFDKQGVCCTLEWNPGNHFRDSELRTAKAFAWVMRQGMQRL